MTEAELKAWAERERRVLSDEDVVDLAAAVLALFAERERLRGLCEWGSGEPVGPKYDRLQNALARAEAAEAKLAALRSCDPVPEGGCGECLACLDSRRRHAEAKLTDLRRWRCEQDCRFTMGDVADAGGIHCPLDQPCARCVARRELEAAEAKLAALEQELLAVGVSKDFDGRWYNEAEAKLAALQGKVKP